MLPPTVKLFQSYLTNRSQYTSINGAKPISLPISAGLPQRSLLGPTPFSIYVNDLPTVCPSNSTSVLLQMTLLTPHVIGTSVADITSMPPALKDCYTWMTRNKHKLNFSKTKCMLIQSAHKFVHHLRLFLATIALSRSGPLSFQAVL